MGDQRVNAINATRHDDAVRRVTVAIHALEEQGKELTINKIAAEAHADKGTVKRVLEELQRASSGSSDLIDQGDQGETQKGGQPVGTCKNDPRWLVLNRGSEAAGGAGAGVAAPSRARLGVFGVSRRDSFPGGRRGFWKSASAASLTDPLASLTRFASPNCHSPR
jgi:hypothetical protein